MAIMKTFPQTPSIPAEHPCPNHDNVQRRLHPFPQSIHVATMMTFPQTLSIPAEHPCSNHDDVPTNSIRCCFGCSCSAFLVPVLFCCGCLLLPACLLFALSRTDPAFLEFRIPRFAVQEEPKSFHAQKPTRKRIFTIRYIGKAR